MLKPYYSKIEIYSFDDSYKIIIPNNGWTYKAIYSCILSILCNALVCMCLYNLFGTFGLYIFTIPLILIGLFSVFYFLYNLLGRIVIVFDRQKIKVTWKLFNKEFSKWGKRNDLLKIAKYEINDETRLSTFAIGFFFKNGNTVKFGRDLFEDERNWLIEELLEIERKISLNLDHTPLNHKTS